MTRLFRTAGVVIGVILLATVWLKFFHDPAVRRQAERLAQADSVEAVEAVRDSADREKSELRDSVMSLISQRDTAIAALRDSLEASGRVVTYRIETLEAALERYPEIGPDLREAISGAVEALQREVADCKLLAVTYQAQVDDLKGQAARDSTDLADARQARADLAARLASTLRQDARSPWLTVSVTVGYGTTLSGGTVYAGPSATLGASLKLFSIGG